MLNLPFHPKCGYCWLQIVAIVSYWVYIYIIVVILLQLDVNTVAAGGGSRLFFRSGMFVVGPESAGAHPGPTCYRKGDYIRAGKNVVFIPLLST